MLNLTPTQHIIAKVSYHTLGLIGYLILRKTRPEFYKNRSNFYMLVVFAVYIYALGPAVFIFSLIILAVDKFSKPKLPKPEPIFFDSLYCHTQPNFFCSFGENGTGTCWCKEQCAPCADGYGMGPHSNWREDKPFSPNWASKPGDTMKDIISEKQISFSTFAYNMRMTEEEANKLVNAETEITSIIARNLSIVLGSSEEFWIKREANYRNQVAKLKASIEEFPAEIGKDIDNIANIINQETDKDG